jgi:predicted RNase H-like nuclease (RuvC/YqgF family)
MVMTFSTLTEKTPIYDATGSTQGDSLINVHQAASKESEAAAKKFQEEVIDYCLEWETVVTKRVEDGLKQTGKLHNKLNHYQNKVESLRKNVKAKEEKGKEPPAKLTQKLERNDGKLNQAWKEHERSASNLCNLLEEVTKLGWKDLYPVLKAFMQWEARRASTEYDIFARLPVVEEEMTGSFETAVNQALPSVTPGAGVEADNDSETTGSYHPDEEKSFYSSEGEVADDETSSSTPPPPPPPMH